MFIFFIELQHSRTSDTKNLFIHISTEEDVRTLSLITMNKSTVVDNICYMYLNGAIILFYLHVQQCFPIHCTYNPMCISFTECSILV